MEKKTYQNEAWEIMDGETDYLWFVTKSSTEELRRKFDIGDIFINAAVCLKCREFVRSINRHDFRSCGCGAVTVDGGSWYAKRMGEPDDYISVVEYFWDAGKAEPWPDCSDCGHASGPRPFLDCANGCACHAV